MGGGGGGGSSSSSRSRSLGTAAEGHMQLVTGLQNPSSISLSRGTAEGIAPTSSDCHSPPPLLAMSSHRDVALPPHTWQPMTWGGPRKHTLGGCQNTPGSVLLWHLPTMSKRISRGWGSSSTTAAAHKQTNTQPNHARVQGTCRMCIPLNVWRVLVA